MEWAHSPCSSRVFLQHDLVRRACNFSGSCSKVVVRNQSTRTMMPAAELLAATQTGRMRHMTTILITGASRGIGRAAAVLAGRSGWSVGVGYLADRAAAEATVAAVTEAGGKAVAVRGDVSAES